MVLLPTTVDDTRNGISVDERQWLARLVADGAPKANQNGYDGIHSLLCATTARWSLIR